MSLEDKLKQRIDQINEKQIYYKLKRHEKNELNALNKQLNKIKEERTINLKKIEEAERKRKEELKKQILQNQLNSRKTANINSKSNTKKLIEDMCILSDITKNEIIEEKKKNPQKFIKTEDALKNTDKKSPLFVMGLLAKNLENNGIVTAIEKESDNKLEEANTSLQFMVNGLGQKKKYDLHFGVDEKRAEVLLNNKGEQEKFINKLRKKLSKEYNIPEDDIIITNPQRGSFQLSVIFKSKDFNLKKDELLQKFKDEPELGTLKDIEKNLLLSACKISEKSFDSRGNNMDGGWGYNETRGGEPYIPPEGWIGYGLSVLDKYDLEKGDKKNDWLSYDNREGEWCIAYHGAGHEKESNEVSNIIKNVAKSNLKQGIENDYADDEDIKHPGQKVGNGVYLSPNPKVMEGYAGIIEIGSEKYKMGFMVRCNPKKIRVSAGNLDFWVLDGNDDSIRPYRILIKKI